MAQDMFGREIAVGDTVVYPVRFSSTMTLKSLIVTFIAVDCTKFVTTTLYGERDGRRVGVKLTPNHVVVVPGASQ